MVVTQSASSYPDIAASGLASNTKPFTFKLPNGFLCGGNIKFSLTVTFVGGQASPAVFPLNVQTGTTTGVATTTTYSGAPVRFRYQPRHVNFVTQRLYCSVGDSLQITGSAATPPRATTTHQPLWVAIS